MMDPSSFLILLLLSASLGDFEAAIARAACLAVSQAVMGREGKKAGKEKEP